MAITKLINIDTLKTAVDKLKTLIAGKANHTVHKDINVIGTTKSTESIGDEQLVFPKGAIFSGTALSAGLTTRGICGVTSPDENGGCEKESVYINFDGDTEYRYQRQLVLQAGSPGAHYGYNLYQYAAARGDAVKGYVDNATVAAAKKATNDSEGNAINTTYRKAAESYTKAEVDAAVSGKVSKSGDTMTGKLTAPKIETGTDEANYFQSKKFRGEGDASTYYHAIDFGYSGHNQVDLYEWGGTWNFYQNQSGKKGGSLVASIQPDGVHATLKGNADTATKATQDAKGNVIDETYIKATDAYTKSETDEKLSGKTDKATTLAGYGIGNAYTKEETDAKNALKADKATTLSGYGITDAYRKEDVYTKTEVNEMIGGAGGVIVSAEAPSKTNVLWIDTGNGGIAKYYDTSSKAWTTVKSVWG
ncbi:hypothetical protein [Eubacterium pyruvativorans]|uniref:hypothetical protein n=1 Tax=Eubacterium pyruvativorans TaxID=155865 RepID=UPI0008839BBD|nr:hypothetical protein [Eubacterium pyruvativorans]SDF29990.1 hypothetical protein SAMN04487889_1178 [Eubacterium pyruvativorans]